MYVHGDGCGICMCSLCPDVLNVYVYVCVCVCVCVMGVAGMVGMIMMRTLRRDFSRYNQMEYAEDADVYANASWLSFVCGEGAPLV